MNDAHWSGLSAHQRTRVAVDRRSRFVTMRDGVRIAIDVYVPRGPSVPPRMPAIVRQTRYLRSLEVNAPFGALGVASQFDLYAKTRREFLRAGYAWVDVDVRGTGASTGIWRSPWFEDEIRDGAEIVDWIVAQPWSSGRVGSLGISYDGTCAEMLLVNRHPAVRAVAPQFSLHDVYTDVAFPGGLHLAWFTEQWARYNGALDRNDYGEAMAIPLRLMARVASASPAPKLGERPLAALGRVDAASFARYARAVVNATVRGVRHVERRGDGAPDAEQLALRARNLDVHGGALRLEFRDDTGVHPEFPERTIDSFSPHAFASELAGSCAAIYSYSGWRDGAYPHAAVKRWLGVRNPGSRLTLGPWAHTGRLRIHAFGLGEATAFDHAAELLDFFDEHLKDMPSRGDGAAVHYFSMGDESWRGASSWPPPGVREATLYLSPDRRLTASAPAKDARDDHRADAGIGTGERSRWRSLLSLVPGDYPDRGARDRSLLVYETAPLEERVEIAGHPTVTLWMDWSHPDEAAVFAYLEDVSAEGRVSYVTEGQLRAIHRKIAERGETASPIPQRTFRRADGARLGAGEVVEMTFDLLPIAHHWKRRHRIRLAIAAADADHFPRHRPSGTFSVHRGATRPSRLVLPLTAGHLR
jgi:hypothetical protein